MTVKRKSFSFLSRMCNVITSSSRSPMNKWINHKHRAVLNYICPLSCTIFWCVTLYVVLNDSSITGFTLAIPTKFERQKVLRSKWLCSDTKFRWWSAASRRAWSLVQGLTFFVHINGPMDKKFDGRDTLNSFTNSIKCQIKLAFELTSALYILGDSWKSKIE